MKLILTFYAFFLGAAHFCLQAQNGVLYETYTTHGNSSWNVHFYDLAHKNHRKWNQETQAMDVVKAVIDEMALIINSNATIEIAVYYQSFRHSHKHLTQNEQNNILAETIHTREKSSSWFNNPQEHPCRYNWALAEHLHGSALDPGNFWGALIRINSDRNWSFNITEPAVGIKYQLWNTVFHEIMHYLGFYTEFKYDTYRGIKRNDDRPWDFKLIGPPNSKKLSDYGATHQDLKDFFSTSGAKFIGINAKGCYQKVSGAFNDVPIQSDANIKPGWSLVHWMNGTFPWNHDDANLEAQAQKAVFYELPGEVTIGALRDIGWDASLSIHRQNPFTYRIKVYPNPISSGQLLNIESEHIVEEILVYSIEGVLLDYEDGKESSLSIDVPKGMYLVRAILESGSSETHKIIVQ